MQRLVIKRKEKKREQFSLNPDGPAIVVPLDRFTVGSSFFLPCVNVLEARKQVDKIASEYSWEVRAQVRIERDLLGVRFFRDR